MADKTKKVSTSIPKPLKQKLDEIYKVYGQQSITTLYITALKIYVRLFCEDGLKEDVYWQMQKTAAENNITDGEQLSLILEQFYEDKVPSIFDITTSNITPLRQDKTTIKISFNLPKAIESSLNVIEKNEQLKSTTNYRLAFMLFAALHFDDGQESTGYWLLKRECLTEGVEVADKLFQIVKNYYKKINHEAEEYDPWIQTDEYKIT